MDRYELSAEDMTLMDATFRLAFAAPARDDASIKLRMNIKEMWERFAKAHVVYIETEDTQL